jgi:hypothetical protein
VSEGQTWSSEDTRVFSCKVFFGPARRSICLTSLPTALTAAVLSEAERIVFAAEGLFLAHDFYYGIPGSEAWIDGLAFQRQNSEYAFVNSAERFMSHETFQRFNAESKLPKSQ